MSDIAEQYQNAFDDIIGKKRLTVRLIHNDEYLCVNSNERELLHTIQEVQRAQFGVEWHFKENMLGKCIMLPLEQHVSPLFNGFAVQYKVLFQQRIQMIIDRYDKKPLDNDKQVFYEQIKVLYAHLVETQVIDFDEYKNMRDLFERIRY